MSENRLVKLDLTYVMAGVRSPRTLSQTNEIEDIRKFWLKHWSEEFEQTGAPEAGWQKHFDQQDLVVALRAGSKVIACHLYSFHDLKKPETLAGDYFKYFKKDSIQSFISADRTNLMSMEYLGVAREYHHNSERISLGKLLLTLSTHLGEALGFDAVFGTPITTSSAPRLTANLSAVTVEENISKYGYTLCLQYIPTNPRNLSIDEAVRFRAEELWASREAINNIGQFKKTKKAA